MGLERVAEKLEALYDGLTELVLCGAVRTDRAVHPHARCPVVHNGEDTFVPSIGEACNVPFARIIRDTGCRWCDSMMRGVGVEEFYAEMFAGLLRAGEERERGVVSAPLNLAVRVHLPLEVLRVVTEEVLSDVRDAPKEGVLYLMKRGADVEAERWARYVVEVVRDEWAVGLLPYGTEYRFGEVLVPRCTRAEAESAAGGVLAMERVLEGADIAAVVAAGVAVAL